MTRIAAAFLSSFFLSTPALGFVSTPVGGHPGELDLNLQFTAERGKTEPTENQDSWFKPGVSTNTSWARATPSVIWGRSSSSR